MIETEQAVISTNTTTRSIEIPKPGDLISREILLHFECMRCAPTKEYNKCLTMIIGTISQNMEKLKDYDFSNMLEYVDDHGLSISHFTDKVEFMHLPGTVLKKSLCGRFGGLVSDCTAYVQLLTLAYCLKYSTDKSLCVVNASYMIGAVELYQPVISSPLRAKILYYANLIYEKYNESNDEYLGILHRHLRYSHTTGDSSCTATLLVLICRFYARKKEFTTLNKFINTPHTIEATGCFTHTGFYNPEKSYLYARYAHYCGFLYLILSKYDQAFYYLSEAMRASPFDYAAGFRSINAKYLILVQLLRDQTSISDYYQHLRDGAPAYALLGKAVSYGNMNVFNRFIQLFYDVYQQDGIINIVGRLRLTVNILAMKTLLNSYSTITIKQIAEKLNMENEEEAHNAVAAYIRLNNVKDISIDCGNKIVHNSYQLSDYGTYPSFELLHRRILTGLENCDMCLKKMIYETKEYYNKMAHDSEDRLFIDEDFGTGGSVMWMNKDNDEGPDAGI